MLLRPRQEIFVQKCADALAQHGNTLGVAPTGAGKTVMLSATSSRFLGRDGRALVLQHRDELVAQNRKTYHAVAGRDAQSGVVNAERKDFLRPVLFAMVQTLTRENNLSLMRPVDLVVTDEAHHAVANSYQRIYEKALELNPDVRFLGVTATPNRGDKKGLKGIFDNVADQITLGELIATGALVRPRTFVVDLGVQEDLRQVKRNVTDFDMSEVAKIMDKQILNDQVVSKWKELAGDRQTVVFCSTVEHCSHVVEAFELGGVSTRMVTGDTNDGERRTTLAAFDRGEFQVLVNVAVLTEGWDCQPVSCVVLLRPSSFASTMIQMVGRGLRRMDPERYPGRQPKTDCIVMDFGTSILTHGSLEQSVDLDPFKADAPQKDCPSCGAKVPNVATECAICGHVFEPEPEEEAEAGDLGLEGGAGDAPVGQGANFILTEIDLFKQSPFKWEELWDGIVLVASAFDAWGLTVFFNGQWYGVGGSKADGIRLLGVGDKMLCLSSADDFLREHGDSDAAAKSKRWLHLPATDKQREFLKIDRHFPMTRYQAACHLTWKFNERGVRAKLEGAAMGRAA